jgi:3-oxoacyl-[acyl-carrier-protein] synthase-3
METVTTHMGEVGLSGVAGLLAPRRHDLSELAAAGLLTSSTEALTAFGFERAHICDADYLPEEMALDAARAALGDAGLQPYEVDLVVWASARPEGHVRSGPSTGRFAGCDPMRGFRYTSAWLQEVLGLHNAEVMAVAQQGCSTMFAALRVARSMLLAEPGRQHALCVGVDVLPPGAPREILYNVISDAACAVVVSRGCLQEKWLGFTQISRGYYCDPAACGPEIVAAYFPTAKAVIDQLLREHGLRPGDIDVVVPTGVSRSSWDILLRLVGISPDRLHVGLPSFGHTITADSFLYLEELRRLRQVPRGSRLLLFTYGFGSSWCGLLLEH